MDKIASVNAALDPILFADAVRNEAAISKFKMSIGATSALPSDDIDDLCCDEPMYFEVDLNNLKYLLGDLENILDHASVGSVGVTSRGVSSEHLFKIWGIDVETAKRTIDITMK